MKVMLFTPSALGGIAEHSHYQARALEKARDASLSVVMLCSPNFLEGRRVDFKKALVFADGLSFFSRFSGRIGVMLDKSWKMVGDQWRFVWEILVRRPDVVILSSYSEYLSPFWIWPHWILARCFGLVYVANLHDPVRDYVVGPQWWHELSVRMAYWPIRVAVVHQKLPEPSPLPKHVEVVEAPVGVYDLQEVAVDSLAIRAAWGATASYCDVTLATSHLLPVTPTASDVVFLAFGFIRDNKNLDLVIRAMVDNPRALLVVMGRTQSQKDKPVEFYQNLAQELGLGERVRFFNEFVPDEKLAGYFAAADVVVLTYDKTFHSQSGVLNVAARARRPVLASAGESPLRECVERFKLGVFVEPDNLDALEQGMAYLINAKWEMRNRQCGEPDWEGYEAFASWDVNVEKILQAVDKVKCSNTDKLKS